jgi:hypothetical protein
LQQARLISPKGIKRAIFISGVFERTGRLWPVVRDSNKAMSTAAQIAANQANAQHSTGPKSETGKAASSMNRLKFGLTGKFHVLPDEDQADYDALLAALKSEHNPVTATEQLLVAKMAEHYWLMQRAQAMVDLVFRPESEGKLGGALNNFMRYQTTNERAFHKTLNSLLKLRSERRKEQIGFESQRSEEAAREAEENRRQEAHEAKIRLQNSKAEWQELNTELKGSLEAVLPGHTRIPFEEIKPFLKVAIQDFVAYKTAA